MGYWFSYPAQPQQSIEHLNLTTLSEEQLKTNEEQPQQSLEHLNLTASSEEQLKTNDDQPERELGTPIIVSEETLTEVPVETSGPTLENDGILEFIESTEATSAEIDAVIDLLDAIAMESC